MSVKDKGDTRPRVVGLTFDQWATLAGQPARRVYQPTREDAAQMRLDWINADKELDMRKKNEAFAQALFDHARGQEGVVLPIKRG
jgi:hypothetical protein